MKNLTNPIAAILIVFAVTSWTPEASAQSHPDVSRLFENQKSSVVFIQTEISAPNNSMNLFNLKMPAQGGQGSGFVVDRDGYIITNNHVVRGATRIQVGLQNGETHEARLVGTDPKTDIALLKIDTKTRLKPTRLGSSSALKVGEWVVAIGNPFGLDHSVTAGIISAKGREIGAGPYDNFLQTDASINPGNSGGPLFNMAGEVVGVNTAIIADGQGIGFAVPIDMVRGIVSQLKAKGYVTRGYLGAVFQPLTALMGETFGLKEGAGVLVSSVEPNGPAHLGGMQPGDIITKLGDRRTRRPKDLMLAIAATAPGASVPIQILRHGQARTVNVRMAVRPDANPRVMNASRQVAKARPQSRGLGVAVQRIDRRIARHFGVQPGQGVIVAQVMPNGPASGALRRGDIVLKVSDQPINTKAQFNQALRGSKSVRLQILRDGRLSFTAIKLGR